MRASVLIKKHLSKPEDEKEPSLEDFKMIMVLGRGTFGKVYLSQLQTTKELFAIKALRKDILIGAKQIENTLLEKNIMLEADHPFLLALDYLF